MAIKVWTPETGFTRKTQPVVTQPPVTEKPKPKSKSKPPPAQPSKPKRPKPSALKRQREYWEKCNRLTPDDYTIADQYLVKQVKTQTPMVFLGYGMTYPCTVTKLWRYDIDLNIDGRWKRIHKLALAAHYKQSDASAVESLLSFDASLMREKPAWKLSEREAVNVDALDKGAVVSLTLRTGHRLEGVVRWFTADDIGLTCDGVKVLMFRHAIANCQPLC